MAEKATGHELKVMISSAMPGHPIYIRKSKEHGWDATIIGEPNAASLHSRRLSEIVKKLRQEFVLVE